MRQPDPYISIVIPSYNRASFLEKNIPEVLKLDYNNYEVIVVDDGSTDNTSGVFDKIKAPNLRYYKKQNEERAAARNYGAALATGDYITFLDSDDLLFHDALKKAATALAEKAYPPFLHMAYEIGTNNKVSKTVRGIKDNDPLILIKGNPLSCMGIFVKKEAFHALQFNPDRNLAGSEDWELWVRMAAHYGLRTDDRIIGRLIEHDNRSVIHVTDEGLMLRKRLAIKYAFEDKAVQAVFGRYRKSVTAYWLTYVSLHLAMDGKKTIALKRLLRAMQFDVRVFFTKRGLVIIKLLLFKRSS
jgi:glycosyltransferase involved in cell wall biosynthesis